MMNVVSDLAVADVRSAAALLRREGLAVPSINHKVVVVPSHAPIVEGGFAAQVGLVAWIRDSLKNHRAIEWVNGARYQCECGGYHPKDGAPCRQCRTPLWHSLAEKVLRHGETKQYEQGAQMLGLRLWPKSRGDRSWRDGRYCILTARMRKGNLRNGENAEVWQYSGLRAWQVSHALKRLGLDDEAAKYAAMPSEKQIHRTCVFVDYVHPYDNHSVKQMIVDEALASELVKMGKATYSPRRLPC